MRQLEAQARRVAAADRPVWIQGETGTGKGVLARWIHAHGPRAEETMVELNCASLPRELVESELFGHERGAFTGAVAPKPGLLELAHRGILFLDEIGDLDLALQPKLLTVLEDQRYRRVGDTRDRQVDIQLIAATHQDLARAVAAARFRSDLFYRISTIPLVVPPLRDRPEDIPGLARQLLDRLSGDLGRGRVELEHDALRTLTAYPWPGNIRELRNVLERAVLLSDRDLLRRQDLAFDGAGPAPAADGEPVTLEELERHHIERTLRFAQGKVEDAARRLGIPRSTLYEKLKRYGIGTRKPE
jgi:DNA-binding NtrC family response regulator